MYQRLIWGSALPARGGVGKGFHSSHCSKRYQGPVKRILMQGLFSSTSWPSLHPAYVHEHACTMLAEQSLCIKASKPCFGQILSTS